MKHQEIRILTSWKKAEESKLIYNDSIDFVSQTDRIRSERRQEQSAK